MKQNMIVVATAILFVVLFIAAATIYNNQTNREISSASREKIEHVQRDHSPTMGPLDAKVTIVEFFDPACGTCSAFYPLVKQLMNDNSGKVNLVLRYLPLIKIQMSSSVSLKLHACRIVFGKLLNEPTRPEMHGSITMSLDQKSSGNNLVGSVWIWRS